MLRLGGVLLLVVLAFAYGVTSLLGVRKKSTAAVGQAVPAPTNFSAIFAMSVPELGQVDIARLNLLCTEGLSGAQGLDVNRDLAVLDGMVSRVRSETERHLYRYQKNPAEHENSEGFFRMLMLTVVLAEDFKIHYDPERKTSSLTATEGDGFFSDSANVFLHGLLGPKRQGTCSSMPVLYVAVGRRLGYPLKLVTTKGHLFVRWEGTGERFNVEATSHGLNRFDDRYSGEGFPDV